MSRRGMVHLVGAGPGDPELITLRGLRRLERADVVVHDRLVSPRLIEKAPGTARRIDVGKSPGSHRWPQGRINKLLIAEARRHRRVVRLKGGDPFVFGRGGEECEALARAGIPFEVVPGVTSAVAAPACAGIPVTDRRYTSAFAVVAGQTRGPLDELDWDALARIGTLVVLMGLGRIREIVAILLAHGRPPTTPVAVVSRASSGRQQVVRGSLADIVPRAERLVPPATIVVGDVVSLGESLHRYGPAARVATDAAASETDGTDLREDVVA